MDNSSTDQSQTQDVYAERPAESQPWDVVIVGSGPAGLTAAIYTTRGAASTLLVGGEKWGGQLMLTTVVDNYPAIPGVQGPELMAKMREHSTKFGAEFLEKNVESADFSKSPFELVAGGQKYIAKSVIIATGSDTRWLGVPGEEKLRGRGVSSCAPCDAPFFKGKNVVVIGGGDAAMEEALVLTKYSSQVTMLHRRDKFRASKAMQKKVLNNPKIKVIWNTEVTEFKGDQKLENVVLKNTKTSETSDFAADGAFVAIGHIPSSKVFSGQVELDKWGYVVKHERDGYSTLTSKRGVFVAGDIHDFHYMQAVTAAGFGCMAGMDALKYLDSVEPEKKK